MIEFIKFEDTPSEKYLGIATVKLYGKIILRYKIVPTKDGTGVFPTSASYKVSREGADYYLPAFIVDSRAEEEEIKSVILRGVRAARNPISVHAVSLKSGTVNDEVIPF